MQRDKHLSPVNALNYTASLLRAAELKHNANIIHGMPDDTDYPAVSDEGQPGEPE